MIATSNHPNDDTDYTFELRGPKYLNSCNCVDHYFYFDKFMAKKEFDTKWLRKDGSVMFHIGLLPEDGPELPEFVNSPMEAASEGELGADFKLITKGGQSFKASKIILIAYYYVFRAMIEADNKEKKGNEATIVDIEFDQLKAMVRFMYTQKADLKDADFALQVLVAADKYNVDSLKTVCQTFIIPKLDDSIAMFALRIAYCRAVKLFKAASLFVGPQITPPSL